MGPGAVNLETFPSPSDRYLLGEFLNSGAFGKVFKATDNQAGNKEVAIKKQKLDENSKKIIGQEYRVLRDLCSHHINLIDFYGIYCEDGKEIWFVMELCGGGSAFDLVHGLLQQNRRMREEHIAYILKETVKGLIYLHEHNTIHCDVKAKNILLTKDGDVKLADFGSSCTLKSNFDKSNTLIGSPAWLAPEIIQEKVEFDNRADVWALGITGIELGDGSAPYSSMHPSRILFQVVRNPPPGLAHPPSWSANYNDFISELLVKNAEHRPYMSEVIEHPFLEQIPKNNHHLTLEMRALIDSIESDDHTKASLEEVAVVGKRYKTGVDGNLQAMYVEDLAALNKINEETILNELQARFEQLEQFQTFVGDVLLILNPNDMSKNIYNEEFQKMYSGKLQSDNAPHIFAIADNAYKNALHHEIPQRIVLSGESGAGKTTNFLHLFNQLLFLGQNSIVNWGRIKGAVKLIHSLTHATTPINDYSTRCVLTADLRFGNTGKVTGAVFNVYQLEKWRISSVDMFQGNFHILYYIYDGLKENKKLDQYKLNSNREYRYLRVGDETKSRGPKVNVEKNLKKFKKILKIFEDFGFGDEEIDTIFKIVAAILIIGEIRIQENDNNEAIIENLENVERVGELLEIDDKKLAWALTNYCLVKGGTAIRRKSTVDEGRDARDVLANNLYARLVDYIVGVVNKRLGIGREIFGEKYSIKLYDYFGFECFKRNHLPQLFINTFNEQLQYHYLQRVFSWECLDIKEEKIDYQPFQYFDNKETLELLLNKSEGVLSAIDEASKKGQARKYILEFIKSIEKNRVCISGNSEFSVCHYTGKVNYDAKEMADKNRDFLPPEIVETLRLSDNKTVKLLFTNKLNKTGNLILNFDDPTSKRYVFKSPTENQYSQIKRIRTSISTFKALSLEILKELSIGSGSGGTHFVRCIQTNLKSNPRNFNRELIKQQIRALSVVETAKARRNGFPHRIPFAEFLRRYQFLAFDFNENVEMNKDNCRLLMVRLNMEGFCIGKSKVFLKYYNEEYLARMYDSQVKKIVKIQSILRGFLAKCKVAKERKTKEKTCLEILEASEDHHKMSEDEAAAIIQKAYREATIRKSYPDFAKDYTVLDEKTCDFIRKFARKWKNNSIFSVLVQYRALKVQDLFNLSQQVHLFNIAAFYNLQQINEEVPLESIDRNAQPMQWLGEQKIAVNKIPFQLIEIPFYDAENLRNSLTNPGTATEKDDNWDLPYRWRQLINPESSKELTDLTKTDENLINLPFNRDPEIPIKELGKIIDDEKQPIEKNSKNEKEQENKFLQNQNINQVRLIKKSPIVKKPEVDYDKINSNTTPANKDFDYIKAPIVNKPRSADPVAELRQIGKKSGGDGSDDPPFNFQGMLRKTNYKKEEVVKKEENVAIQYSLRKNQKNVANGINSIGEKKVRVELIPGIFLEGVEIDL